MTRKGGKLIHKLSFQLELTKTRDDEPKKKEITYLTFLYLQKRLFDAIIQRVETQVCLQIA